MGAVATFNYGAWTIRYPEFATVGQPLADAYFAEATLYLDNTGSGPVRDVGQQLVLLNMLTAHIAALNAGVNGELPSPLVGRVTQAGEGSVNVSADMPNQPGSAAWFQMTKYGAAFWAATMQFRTFRLGLKRQRSFDSFRGFGGWPYGF